MRACWNLAGVVGLLIVLVGCGGGSGSTTPPGEPAVSSIDAAKTQQCGPKFAAPFDLGSGENATFQDAAAGVKIEVLSENSGSYKVRVTNSRH